MISLSNEDNSEIRKTLQNGTKDQKIGIIRSLENTADEGKVKALIEMLDDEDIEVRGETFCVLIINPNDIAKHLVNRLGHERKNVRGFSSLVLANRGEKQSARYISPLVHDKSSLVRSCAIASLGYLRADRHILDICSGLNDENIEVVKTALKSILDIGNRQALTFLNKLPDYDDSEYRNLLNKVRQHLGDNIDKDNG